MQKTVYQGAIMGRPGNYGILFPDFLGCISGGDSVEATQANGHEALQLHVDGMQEDGEPIPRPGKHTLESVAAEFAVEDDPDPDNWVGLYPVTVNVAEDADPVRVELPAGLVRQVGTFTHQASRFVQEATRRELERLKKTA
jgi:predicted RNase H-like HicB family nuclease